MNSTTTSSQEEIVEMKWVFCIAAILVSAVHCMGFILPDIDECQPIQSGCRRPIWFEPWRCTKNETICKCSNTNLDGIVHCNEQLNSSLLLSGYCMTSSCDNQSRTLYVGECPFSMLHGSDISKEYSKLPPNLSELNAFMCGSLNRTGLLCSKCKKHLGTAIFSPIFQCIECSASFSEWMLYTFLTFFPPTLFFIIVLLFQLRAHSAALNYFIFISQYILVTVASTPLKYHVNNPATKVMLTFYGFWNLDFFRYVIPPFCASNKLTTIHILSLEYIIAFYPLVLIAIVYICVELHDRDCRVLVCLWKPFHRCFSHLRRRWDPKASIIHTFATFLLLSYSKLLFVSARLLRSTRVYNSTMKNVGPPVWYYDASVSYLRHEHLPFFCLAILVLAIFVAPPTLLLLLYPTKLFQKCLGCCRVRWHALHTFADAFQGCYENGTDGTRDCRYFAGLYFIIRIVFITVVIWYSKYSFGVGIIVSVGISLIFLLVRPYKNNYFNVLDSFNFALLALSVLFALYNVYGIAEIPQALTYLLLVIPQLYFTVYLMYGLLLCTSLFYSCFKQRTIRHTGSCDSLFPDRLVNTHYYTDLLDS